MPAARTGRRRRKPPTQVMWPASLYDSEPNDLVNSDSVMRDQSSAKAMQAPRARCMSAKGAMAPVNSDPVLIPEPRDVVFKVAMLRDMLGLQHEPRDDLWQLTRSWRAVAEKYLDFTKTGMQDQNPDDIKNCIEDATERFPFLKKYQHSWPLTLYMKHYLSRSRRRNVPATRTRSKVREDGSESVDSGSKSRRLRSASPSMGPRPSPEPNASRSYVIPEMSSGSRMDPAEPVREFLRSVDLEFLFPAFIRYGIRDRKSLQIVAAWPFSQRERALAKIAGYGPMTDFHVQLLEIALDDFTK